MKVVFFSNFLNHHQLPFCLEMIKKDNVEFTFVATEPTPEERRKLGYEDMNKKHSFVLTTYDSKQNYDKAMKIATDADLVIIGSAPDIFIKERINLNKIIFRYQERVFKKGRWRVISPRALMYLYKNHIKYKNNKIFMLCASAYTAGDYKLVGTYKNKCYKWGYFPQVKEYNINELIDCKEKNETIKFIWVGRFINWKHPELVVELGKYLKKKNYKFTIEMIGTGLLEDNIKKKVIESKLENEIKLLGAIQADDVRKYMENSNIFLCTSDNNEGWGAVLNEAMNSGCAVLVNRKIGSAPYLICENKNGLTYLNKKTFFKKAEQLLNNQQLRDNLSKEAYYTMTNMWNAKTAANNLIELYKNMEINDNVIDEGPCSKEKDIL